MIVIQRYHSHVVDRTLGEERQVEDRHGAVVRQLPASVPLPQLHGVVVVPGPAGAGALRHVTSGKPGVSCQGPECHLSIRLKTSPSSPPPVRGVALVSHTSLSTHASPSRPILGRQFINLHKNHAQHNFIIFGV